MSDDHLILSEDQAQELDLHAQMREQFEEMMRSAPNSMIIFYEKSDGRCAVSVAGAPVDLHAVHEVGTKALAQMLTQAMRGNGLNG